MIHKGNIFHDGSLSELTQRLSPDRCVKIELTQPIELKLLERFGEVIDYQDNLIQIIIQKDQLASNLSSLLQDYPVRDLEVKYPPIEELIGKLISSGKLD